MKSIKLLIASIIFSFSPAAFADTGADAADIEILSAIQAIIAESTTVADECKTANGCGANKDPNRKIINCEKSADGTKVKFTLESRGGIKHTMECWDFKEGGCMCL